MTITQGSSPVRLPVTPDEFNAFVDALGDYSGIKDIRNYQHAIATMIMHHPQDSCMKTPDSFIDAIRKAQANEVAYGVLMLIKQQTEKKKQDEALLDGGLPPKASNGQISNTTVQTSATQVV